MPNVNAVPSFQTTVDQREQLLTDGFVLLPDGVQPELLDRLRELATRMEDEALASYSRNEPRHGACVVEDEECARIVRQDDILGGDASAVLDLLACPAMMAIAREMCGRGTVPMQADILYKHHTPESVVIWHQGAPHPRGYPYLNVGVYLDDADAGDGCLRYVPATQHELQDICSLSEAHGWEIPGVVEQPAKAGDILVQDMMVLHGSKQKLSQGVRRTIYIELRPALGILESGVQSPTWIQLRERWMALVVRRAEPAAWPADWQADLPQDMLSDVEETDAILAVGNLQYQPFTVSTTSKGLIIR